MALCRYFFARYSLSLHKLFLFSFVCVHMDFKSTKDCNSEFGVQTALRQKQPDRLRQAVGGAKESSISWLCNIKLMPSGNGKS